MIHCSHFFKLASPPAEMAFYESGRRLTITNSGRRSRFGANEAIQLGPQLNNNTDVVSFDANFDNPSLTVDSIRGITQFVQENPSLRYFGLTGHGTNVPVIEAILAAASGNRNIQTHASDLSASAAHVEFLQNSPQLERLIMYMVDTVSTLPPNALPVAIASMPSLEYLELIDEPNAVYTAPIINALGASQSLRKLELHNLPNNDPSRRDALVNLLRRSPVLETLSLQNYELVDLGPIFSALSQSLVRTLVLADVDVHDEQQDRTSAAEALRGNTTLLELKLEYNCWNLFRAFCTGLPVNTTLEHLDVEILPEDLDNDNDHRPPDGDLASCFASLLRNLPALQHLTFHLHWQFGDDCALPVAVLEAFKEHASLKLVQLTGLGTGADLAIIRSVCDRNRYNSLRDLFVELFVVTELAGLPGLLEGVSDSEFSLSLIYDGLRIRRKDWAD